MSADEIEDAELDALFVFVPAQPTGLSQSPPLRCVGVEGETAGVALGNLRDAVADGGVDAIAALTVTASAGAGQGTSNLRALGHCASQLPRFECTMTVSLQVEFAGLGEINADLAGSIADWRRIEQAMFTLADLGSAAGGMLTMRLVPPSPITVDGKEWAQFRSVLANNNPGALSIEAEPADNATSGGGQ